MSAGTKIEWTDASWNPVTGCTHCEGTIEHPQRLRLRDSRGRVMDEWPADLRIREWPHAAEP